MLNGGGIKQNSGRQAQRPTTRRFKYLKKFFSELSCKRYSPLFPNNRHTDLSGVLHFVLNFL